MFKGVTKEKMRKHIFVEGTILLLMMAAIMGAINYQDATNDDQASFRLASGDTVHDLIHEIGPELTVMTTIENMDTSNTLEYAIITVDLAEPGFQDFKVDWDQMKILANENCTQNVPCVASLLPGDESVIELQSPNVFTFIFLHHSGDNGVMEVQVVSEYDKSSTAMNKAIALSIPSLYITGFVIYRLLRLSKNGKSWFDSTPSHTWEEE